MSGAKMDQNQNNPQGTTHGEIPINSQEQGKNSFWKSKETNAVASRIGIYLAITLVGLPLLIIIGLIIFLLIMSR